MSPIAKTDLSSSAIPRIIAPTPGMMELNTNVHILQCDSRRSQPRPTKSLARLQKQNETRVSMSAAGRCRLVWSGRCARTYDVPELTVGTLNPG